MKQIFLILLLSMLALTPIGHAQEAGTLAQFDLVRDQAKSALEHPAVTNVELAKLRRTLTKLSEEVNVALTPLNKLKSEIVDQLAALGPIPDSGQSTESSEIKEKRNKLIGKLSQLDAKIKALDLKKLEADTLVENIINYRRARFVDRLSYRGPAPSSLAVWQGAWRQTLHIYQRLGKDLGSALKHTGFDGHWKFLSSLLAGGFLAYVIGFPIRRILIRRFSYGKTITAPNYSQRIREAALVGLARSLPILLAVLVLAVSLKILLPLNEAGLNFLAIVVAGLSFFAIWTSFSRTVFAPRRPAWRIPAISDASAHAALIWVRWLAFIPAVDFPLRAIGGLYEASRSLISIHDFLITLLIAIPLVGLTRSKLWQSQERLLDAGEPTATPGSGGERSKSRFPVLRFLVAASAVAAPIIAFLGFTELGFFIASRLWVSAALISLLVLTFLISRDLLLIGLGRSHAQDIHAADGNISDKTPMLHFWWSFALGLVFLTLGIIGLAVLWGVAQDDLTSWVGKLLTGFEVGGMTISLLGIGIAIAVFLAIVMGTRYIQRILGNTILPMTRLDQGAQDSLKTMVGYVGFVIAALAAIYAAGFDLTNLAIVAGALSLGIGFGLQNVVNNFVSGLILLAERPIKVGDWVITSSAQGYVKRIKVRATEVETFDNATVIIPNSELISAPVTNLFFKDRNGRVVIPIGVAYDSDAEKVKEILLGCARDNPRVLRYPAPSAYLVNFGDSSLDFSLRFYLGDIDWMMSAGSDVRFEILKRFREENIEIPFPQRDINLRDISRLEGVIKKT